MLHSQCQSPSIPSQSNVEEGEESEYRVLLGQHSYHSSPSQRKYAALVDSNARLMVNRSTQKLAGSHERGTRVTTFQSLPGPPISNNRRVPGKFETPNTEIVDSSSTMFTASSAMTPIRRVGTTETLISCLTSASKSVLNHSESSSVNQVDTILSSGKSPNQKNGEPKTAGRNVSFSHSRVREYEVTLGDNPSVSSGVPLSLGWRYNPTETIFSLLDSTNGKINKDTGNRRARRRRSMDELLLSNCERRHRLVWHSGTNVSIQDIYDVLQFTEEIRLERRESIRQLNNEMFARKKEEEIRQTMKKRKQI